MCHSTYVFRNNVTTTLDESITTSCQRQIDGSTRWATKSNHILQFLQIVFLRIAGCKYNIDNVFLNFLIQIYLTHNFTSFDDLISFQNRLHIQLISVYILTYNQFLLFQFRIVDDNFQHKTVHLCFGQRICTFLLNRVLGSKHQEWFGQLEGLLAYCNLTFLHSFQQGTLDFGRSTIYFIRQYEISKYRTSLHLESLIFLTVNHCTDNVGRQQVRRKLNTAVLRVDQWSQRFDS